jgi:hypothetical protein
VMEAPSGPLMPVAIRKLTPYGLKILRGAPNETDAIRQLVEAHRVYLANPQSLRAWLLIGLGLPRRLERWTVGR